MVSVRIACSAAFLLALFTGMPASAADVERISSPPSGWTRAPATPILTIGDPPRHLSQAQIETLPLYATKLETNWGKKGQFHGVLLTDLLAANGMAQVERIKMRGTDDYVLTLDRAAILAGQPLLATRFEGEPLTSDPKGPLILLWPDRAEKVLNGTAPVATWIWSLVQISERK